MVPRSGRSSPVIRLNNVVFPAPLGPMMRRRSPGSTARLTFEVTRSPPNDFSSFATASALTRSDYVSGAEPRDLLGSVAELFQDFVGVLAEGRRAVAEAARRLREVDGRRRQRRRPRQPGILAVAEKAGRPDVRVFERLLRRVEGPRRNPRSLELGECLRRRALGGPLA